MYPETKGVPLEEMDMVFGEGMYLFLSHSISNRHITGENKCSSSGSLPGWFNRIFTKNGSSSGGNRTRTFTERESYTPLRADHDHEGQDGEENDDGEDYELIKRNPDHES